MRCCCRYNECSCTVGVVASIFPVLILCVFVFEMSFILLRRIDYSTTVSS